MIVEKNHTEKTFKLDYSSEVPHIIKYMGSKRELLDFLVPAIQEVYNGEAICDLFAGTSVLSGAIGHSTNIISNDIQEYSSIFSKTYLGNYNWKRERNIITDVIKIAQAHVDKVKDLYPNFEYSYEKEMELNEFNALEQAQQDLIYFDFADIDNHLFIKNYSGTYWSFEQCLWIDALRTAAEEYSNESVYYPILSSLMFAMAYNAQSTGHYAQYRDANNIASKNDIIIYRRKKIVPLFTKKMEELISFTKKENRNDHSIMSLDYRDCLELIPDGTIVYADPPYTFVHYSRFYHALETLVKYDFPNVLYKGRYRTDRHQSPFCKKTEVKDAFTDMFEIIRRKNSKILLSYSNTGMISLDNILNIAKNVLGKDFDIKTKAVDYNHSTMGRSEDKNREVKEYLIIAKPK